MRHCPETQLPHLHVISATVALEGFLCAGSDEGGFRDDELVRGRRRFLLQGLFRRSRTREMFPRERKHGAYARDETAKPSALFQERTVAG